MIGNKVYIQKVLAQSSVHSSDSFNDFQIIYA